MMDDEEEIVAVVYHETDGAWYPHSIQTRMPRREWVANVPRPKRPRLPGWVGKEYDADYSKAAGSVYVHNSGSGGDGNEVYIGAYAHPEAMPARIWLHTDAKLVKWSKRKKRNVPMSRSKLASLGYALLDELPGDPFEDACEGATHWCDACEDNIPKDGDDIFTCAVCREYGHEHGVGQAFVVVEAEKAGLDAGPGIYKITRWPYYAYGMVTGYLLNEAWERIGPLPEGVGIDTEGYPCAKLCDECRDRLLEGNGE